jgi:hypothetical protein
MSIGQTVTIEALERDPYPIYERLRDEEPVSWVPAVGLWLVTRFDDVRGVDLDPETFTAATQPSTLNRTMGVNMLGMEGPDQQRIRRIVETPFRPRDVERRTQGAGCGPRARHTRRPVEVHPVRERGDRALQPERGSLRAAEPVVEPHVRHAAPDARLARAEPLQPAAARVHLALLSAGCPPDLGFARLPGLRWRLPLDV